MEGADESTELWQHSNYSVLSHFPLKNFAVTRIKPRVTQLMSVFEVVALTCQL